MKKLAILLFLLLAVGNTQDFRNSNWGETIQEVKKKETKKLFYDNTKDDELSTLVYEDRISGFNSYLWYMFNHDYKLCGGFYWFQVKHTNDNLYIDDYEKVKKNVSIKYGEGITESKLTNKLLEDNLGLALSLGFYELNTKWETHNTIIVLLLYSDNFEIKFALGYISKTVTNKEKSHF